MLRIAENSKFAGNTAWVLKYCILGIVGFIGQIAGGEDAGATENGRGLYRKVEMEYERQTGGSRFPGLRSFAALLR